MRLDRTSRAQADNGTRISPGRLEPGDLVVFSDDLHHMGFHAGDGRILHSPEPGAGVRHESIDTMPFMFGVRIRPPRAQRPIGRIAATAADLTPRR